jgi:hypothetical protein
MGVSMRVCANHFRVFRHTGRLRGHGRTQGDTAPARLPRLQQLGVF